MSSNITVIMPCYNHSRYLEARIQSVLNQSLAVEQIIFLDDASTDDSFDVARKLLQHTDIDVYFHRNETNSGSTFAQWNNGIRLAKHEFIWLAETDDSCDTRMLEKLHSTLLRSDAVVAYAQSNYIDKFGNVLGSALSHTDTDYPGQFSSDFVMDGVDFKRKFMSLYNTIPNASAVLFKKNAYLEAGQANPSMRYCGDWDVWIRLCDQGKVVFLAEELNQFRSHENTTRATGVHARAGAETIACIINAFFRDGIAKGKRITLALLAKNIINSQQRKRILYISSVNRANSLTETKNYYANIKDVPVLTGGAWAFLKSVRQLRVFTLKITGTIIFIVRKLPYGNYF